MKKFLVIGLLILALTASIDAELIDGPANIRETPGGKVLFSLQNDSRVQCKAVDENWLFVSFTAWVRSDGVLDGKQIKKDAVLYDYSGREIGKTLSIVTPGKVQKLIARERDNSGTQFYVCELGGYTFKDNIQTISAEKARIIAARFHENPRNPARAIPNSRKDVIVKGITYYYFEIVFERGAAAEVFVSGKTGDVHGYGSDAYYDHEKVLGSISQALEAGVAEPRNPGDAGGTSYQNQSLGIGFTIPKSWEGKYRIEATPWSITVYFSPKEKVEFQDTGMLFMIVKRSKDIYESVFDGLGKRYIKAKNVIYVIGGPTDMNFPGDHKEFKDFLKVQQKVRNVVATIHEI